MKTFKITLRLDGYKEPFVDWYEAATQHEAFFLHDADMTKQGISMTHESNRCCVEMDAETLQPLEACK